jgi:three-Cys-motif partner protein
MSHTPKELRWPLEEHSRAKHAVLRAYLQAWLPISGFTEDSFLFIDGFAGPGRYESGEEGSPLIAVRTYLEHSARPRLQGRPYFLFIEGDEDRAQALTSEVAAMLRDVPNPPVNNVEHGTFHDVLNSLRDYLTEHRLHLKPAFVMVDPFGISDSPMSDLQWLLSNPKCELYVSLMASFITRFDGMPGFEMHLDSLFGTPKWRDHFGKPNTEKRKALLDLYECQLRAASPLVKVLRFDIFDGNSYKYTIFHAAKHDRACERMKQAIWALDPDGGFRFRGRGDQAQLSLFGSRPWQADLEAELLARIPQTEWLPVAALEDFLRSDRTRFHPTQLRSALKTLETRGAIVVDPATRKRRGSFQSSVKIQRAAI